MKGKSRSERERGKRGREREREGKRGRERGEKNNLQNPPGGKSVKKSTARSSQSPCRPQTSFLKAPYVWLLMHRKCD